ncbi:transporter substrate-binding domain-containing protein [Longimicrobium terrae]|uniref:Polar amino acid transport system substrate-binding protein n=1 Tax=Longimicrobium terrae TaxID=1639882 RepID=A0A841H2R9_9BACT|nr:transporter substrate-binding domain-containing protein [Longimicrobium terrae]MBB4638083.1 polar amino acid transport system substrate-binding protein [Longimicrobium terrae]MBB6072455.1 polar amino acid transport system substrate-binding protein [Longimicrobium terrae]NNC32133.1 transporter substrate-binding domain-containing protein [Longimicrobium terrae]
MRPRTCIAALLILAAGCDLPRDPQGTRDRVRDGTLRVGVAHNPPWAALPAPGEPGGVEPALVRKLAAELGARVEWVAGSETELLASLEEHRLDLVVGGLAATDPRGVKLGFSRPYYTDTVAVGAAPDGAARADLRGVRVGVERSRTGAADLASKGAIPIPADALERFPGLVAAPVWRLEQAGRQRTDIVLSTEARVIAAPPGENAWLVTVERFLRAHEDEVPAMLRRERP